MNVNDLNLANYLLWAFTALVFVGAAASALTQSAAWAIAGAGAWLTYVGFVTIFWRAE